MKESVLGQIRQATSGFIFLVLLVSGPSMSKDQHMWAAVSMMLFPIIIYSIVWILNGVTVMELKIQKRALLVLLILCFPLYGILVWFFYKGDPSNKLFMSLVMALGGTLAVGILVWIINYLAKKKTEVALQDKN